MSNGVCGRPLTEINYHDVRCESLEVPIDCIRAGSQRLEVVRWHLFAVITTVSINAFATNRDRGAITRKRLANVVTP